jgi:hypothetical protein
MDRVLVTSRAAGYEGYTAHTGGIAYSAVGGGRHVAGDFEVLRRGSEDEIVLLIDKLRSDRDRLLDLLDAFCALEPVAKEELADAVTGHIVNDTEHGGWWAMFLAGLMTLGQLSDLRHQQAVCTLLFKANALNSNPDRIQSLMQAQTEHLRLEEQMETERVQRENRDRVELARAETERLRRREPMSCWEMLSQAASHIPGASWLFRKSESAPADQDRTDLSADPGHKNFLQAYGKS